MEAIPPSSECATLSSACIINTPKEEERALVSVRRIDDDERNGALVNC